LSNSETEEKNIVVVTSNAIKQLKPRERSELLIQLVRYNNTSPSNHPDEDLKLKDDFVALNGMKQVKDSIKAWFLGTLERNGKLETAVGENKSPILFGVVENESYITENNFEDGVLDNLDV